MARAWDGAVNATKSFMWLASVTPWLVSPSNLRRHARLSGLSPQLDRYFPPRGSSQYGNGDMDRDVSRREQHGQIGEGLARISLSVVHASLLVAIGSGGAGSPTRRGLSATAEHVPAPCSPVRRSPRCVSSLRPPNRKSDLSSVRHVLFNWLLLNFPRGITPPRIILVGGWVVVGSVDLCGSHHVTRCLLFLWVDCRRTAWPVPDPSADQTRGNTRTVGCGIRDQSRCS